MELNTKQEMISIVVPVHNAERYIEKTVESILAQTIDNYEVLLVEDNSTDGSFRILKEISDQRVRVLKTTIQHGAAAARNLGVAEAKGRYIAFLDADDLWKPDKLEKTLKFMQEKDTAFVFTGYEFGDQEANGTGKVAHVPEQLDYEHALSRTVIFTSTVMLDLNKLDKELIRMPQVKSEDTATW